MKIDKQFMQTVAVSIISAVIVFTLINHGQKVVVVNDDSSRAPFVGASMITGGVDPDWYTLLVGKEDIEPIEIFVEDIVEIVDGDTIKIMLDMEDYHEKTECTFRLAGVNCPEEFDQQCYIYAREVTNDYLFIDEENADKEYDYRFFVYLVDIDKNKGLA